VVGRGADGDRKGADQITTNEPHILTDAERAAGVRTIESGTWPQHCVQRAFVAGAAWFLWQTTGATPWPEERDAAEQEAVRRYGEPGNETRE
jgi:hypothetical protein